PGCRPRDLPRRAGAGRGSASATDSVRRGRRVRPDRRLGRWRDRLGPLRYGAVALGVGLHRATAAIPRLGGANRITHAAHQPGSGRALEFRQTLPAGAGTRTAAGGANPHRGRSLIRTARARGVSVAARRYGAGGETRGGG